MSDLLLNHLLGSNLPRDFMGKDTINTRIRIQSITEKVETFQISNQITVHITNCRFQTFKHLEKTFHLFTKKINLLGKKKILYLIMSITHTR